MPSVPVSVYRELALELQATQATIDALKSQNQQLARQNHQLRQEIEKVVQHVAYLQQVVDTTVVSQIEADRTERERQVKSKRPPSGARTGHHSVVTTANASSGHSTEFVAVEEVEADNRYRRSRSDAAQMGGWRLAIAVLIVVVTAFSTGFLLVRPFAPNR
jgi:cobalamin biosynthesis Mg chelatase CobN